MEIISGIKSGALGGLFGAWAIFGIILAIDSTLGFEMGTFYKVIVLAIGLNTNAVYIGFLMHMITGVVIGALFGLASVKMRVTASRVISLGVVTGIITWAGLFLPLTLFIVNPSLSDIAEMINEPMLIKIVEEPLFMIGALSMHLVYGFVLGLMHYLGVAEVPRVAKVA